ncbi:hypothetical protein EVAR_65063_1 [Eumeta japonica]|uniref:Uncharacterized protein n=1 Tax=Eumeta variegata TaxID=151549 RepID=A0A4C1ZVM8_EUMVA|nr:hypothetical protein EVAR_65063_1 [Eumeta japonica]
MSKKGEKCLVNFEASKVSCMDGEDLVTIITMANTGVMPKRDDTFWCATSDTCVGRIRYKLRPRKASTSLVGDEERSRL